MNNNLAAFLIIIASISSCTSGSDYNTSDSDYKVYKTGNSIDSVVYKVYNTQAQIEKGIDGEWRLVVTKDYLGRGDILTFTGGFKGRPNSWSYLCYGEAENKGEHKFKNGITTTETIIGATCNSDRINGAIHWIHKYYLDGELVLIMDEDVATNNFLTYILSKRMQAYNETTP